MVASDVAEAESVFRLKCHSPNRIFREAIVGRHAGIKAVRAGCAALFLQAKGMQRIPAAPLPPSA